MAARFADWARDVVYRPGIDARVVPAIRGMKREIDRARSALQGKEPIGCAWPERIDGEPVDGVGRDGDDLAGVQRLERGSQ